MLKVLVIDDSVDIVETIKQNIGTAEYSFDVASDLKSAEEKIGDSDAIILDLNLDPINTSPESTQLAGLSTLKEALEKKYKLIIVFSAYTSVIPNGHFLPGPLIHIIDKGKQGGEYTKIRGLLQKFNEIKSGLDRMKEEINRLQEDIMLSEFQMAFERTNFLCLSSELVRTFVSFRLSTYLSTMAAALVEKIPSQAIFIRPQHGPTSGDDTNAITGDIFSDESGKVYLIITPSCDLVISKNRKPKTCNLLALRCYTDKDQVKCSPDGLDIGEIDLSKKSGFKCYFAPSDVSNTGKLYISLKNPNVLHFKDIRKLKKISTMASPYVESLQSEFARELSRIGVPDLKIPED